MLLARPFLSVWLGEPYASLAPLAQLFVSYWLVAVLTSFAGQAALATGQAGLLGGIALATAAVNLVLSLALVRTWGVAGVVAGTLVAYGVAIPAQVGLVFPRLGVSKRRFWREVVRPVYGPALPVALGWWALLGAIPEPRDALFLTATGAAVLASFAAVLWFAAVEPRDRARMLAALRRAPA